MTIWRRFSDGIPNYLARHYWWAYLWRPGGRLLQLTCVYGQLSPGIVRANRDCSIFVCDVAAVQLEAVQHKLNDTVHDAVCLTRMNAEQLAFKDNSFATVLVFLLLHELPADARSRVLDEIARVIEPQGQVIIVEYAPLPTHHFLYRVYPVRWLLTRLEPFLEDFWKMDLLAIMRAKAREFGKDIARTHADYFFDHFYRVEVYQAG